MRRPADRGLTAAKGSEKGVFAAKASGDLGGRGSQTGSPGQPQYRYVSALNGPFCGRPR